MNTIAGSLFYAAPEVYRNLYDYRCDLWSAGIIAFALLTGRFPFDGKNEKEILHKINKQKLKFF